jgi:hypothetical protein
LGARASRRLSSTGFGGAQRGAKRPRDRSPARPRAAPGQPLPGGLRRLPSRCPRRRGPRWLTLAEREEISRESARGELDATVKVGRKVDHLRRLKSGPPQEGERLRSRAVGEAERACWPESRGAVTDDDLTRAQVLRGRRRYRPHFADEEAWLRTRGPSLRSSSAAPSWRGWADTDRYGSAHRQPGTSGRVGNHRPAVAEGDTEDGS